MIDHVFSKFCDVAKKASYTLQPLEAIAAEQIRKQTEEKGLDPDIYQTHIVYVTGRYGQNFDAAFFFDREKVEPRKQHLFSLICEVIAGEQEVYAFLKHDREFSSSIRSQIELCGYITTVHPHWQDIHISVVVRGERILDDKVYMLPEHEDILPPEAFSFESERLVVGFKYSKGLSQAGKVALFDRPFYSGVMFPPPRKVVSLDECA